MPARRFFALLKAGRRLVMNEYSELCDIAAIPMCDAKYFKQLKGGYMALSQPVTTKQREPQQQNHVIDSGGDGAKEVFMSLFLGRPN